MHCLKHNQYFLYTIAVYQAPLERDAPFSVIWKCTSLSWCKYSRFYNKGNENREIRATISCRRITQKYCRGLCNLHTFLPNLSQVSSSPWMLSGAELNVRLCGSLVRALSSSCWPSLGRNSPFTIKFGLGGVILNFLFSGTDAELSRFCG